MVNEVTPAKGPLSSRKPDEQIQEAVSTPEFGKPTPLRSTQTTSQIPFNIPKNNRPRVEHHRPPTHQVHYIPSETGGSRITQQSTSKQPFNPFKPVVPSTYTSQGSVPVSRTYDDVVGIKRPSQFTWNTKPAAPPIFSSNPSGPTKPSAASKTLQNFIDLTKAGDANRFGQPSYQREFSSADTYSYIDSAKAQENIKALLEGAFEDEEDKPRTRARKKKVEADINDLAAKLQQVSVGSDEKQTKEAGPEDDEEEEEEEVDDGTREGLKVKLLPHQIEGVEWMCEKENGQKKTRGVLPKGGILADDMGLGKTIQSIALILTNPRPSRQKTKDGEKNDTKKQLPEGVDKCTLIVAPLALIKQWESEIADKIEKTHKLRVCVYHGAGRTKFSADLKDYDVVITTYGTLSSEHGASGKGNVGCFNIHWYRVILDEAHTIKNRNAKATQAACALNAQYRWCLTGTPLQNNLDELQSLIKFLRIKPFDELATWREQITQPLNNGRGGLAIKRLQIFLKAFMKRRTKDVLKLNNNLKPGGGNAEGGSNQSSTGFQIVKREVVEVEAEFTPAEVEFYNRLEQRTDRRLSQMMGGSKLDYASALVMLLRLRQACNHPDLVKSDLAEDKDILLNNVDKNKSAKKDDDLDKVADLFGGLSVVSRKCDICQVELTAGESETGASRCSECADLDIELKSDKKKKSKKPKSKKHKESKPASQEPDTRKVRARRNLPDIEDSSEDEDDGEWIVPKGQRPSTNLGTAGGSDDEDAEGGGEWIGSDDSHTEDEDEVISISDSDEEEEYEEEDDDEYDGPDIVPSTKVRALIRILRKEAPEYKFIVFSVFTQMLDKIEPFLKRAKLGYARYDGSMRNDLREASLEKLRNHSNTRILLCSLRAGALGLNLTAASRVVILEPFWNPFVEEQAIDRVHRLNQTIDVKIYKITIKNTVEERILDLQERKRELANATIEGKAAAGKLTMQDMMALFGREAEARLDHERGAPDLTSKTRLLVSKNEDDSISTGTGSSWSLPSSQSSSKDVRRKQDRQTGRQDDTVYGRRW
ncbi:SNF2 family helicase/ATPase, putative [Talaromyces stipitatus ATCC 10500]|uniref:SNF2 family helicase/ATPase, putative n=1 Tax=Talaromyces stipitatus (strain ATCC 10500 / CBS 375.48 / QM 6759 / NRRL 1006) TaxID=441959 RepID=B8LYL9_TALSN|nr:SNF2 family helicase/ATPase, putative [Talaromyces stipitatus ATCC 10500]EED23377.1 SNF2 family helicase/ATPase, putative [Talaromyces stipitatus ATCC 10500]